MKKASQKARDGFLWAELEEAIKVFAFGKGKHKAWLGFENGDRDVYYAKMKRHAKAYMDGDRQDAESGLSHMAHAICNALFIMRIDSKKKDKHNGQPDNR
jgi:hypothetical protein